MLHFNLETNRARLRHVDLVNHANFNSRDHPKNQTCYISSSTSTIAAKFGGINAYNEAISARQVLPEAIS